ncbi:acetyltransferase [Daejeonella lutea]|uniref:Sugar O-acyltransferase, sialic acid O-acetyltransferase NeuD family n=1 Tax=Daejeonella lutea TaxID=572036 RepID=A0A1T5FAU9_9SPHI|nr:acetyltransferase [Daejeonella lutea]SKB93256.1 sugar O-acyltransferase, sialic acid O-acetyltransferase NeuD family [Daejeonella lutea]
MFYLIGAGGHAKVILEILEDQMELIGGLVDTNNTITQLLDYPVTKGLEDIYRIEEDKVIVSIGANHIRKIITDRSKNKYRYGRLVHSKAIVSSRSSIGVGTVIMPGVVINTGVSIGEHCIINTSTSIDHDCYVGDFAHLSPNSTLAGNVQVGEGAHIGIGASIIPGIKIGKWATIGAGAVIIRDVPDFAVVIGVPGKVIRYNNTYGE